MSASGPTLSQIGYDRIDFYAIFGTGEKWDNIAEKRAIRVKSDQKRGFWGNPCGKSPKSALNVPIFQLAQFLQ